MYKHSLIFTALALILGCQCTSVLANDANDSHLGAGIQDVTDPELSDMRGRYTVGDNTVVWFGVQMITTFQTNSGQVLQSAMTLGMNFSKNPNSPQVTFVPTVTITTANAALPTASTVQSQVNRSVQSGGIANVGGLVQSVQVAGDNNAVANVTSLTVKNGGSIPGVTGSSNTSSNTPASTINTSSPASTPSASTASVDTSGSMVNTSSSTTNLGAGSGSGTTPTNASAAPANSVASTTNTGTSTPDGRTATVGNASVSSTYSNGSAEVSATVAGEGAATQWIHNGNLGQTIALTADNTVVTNQMIVNLVTQQMGSTMQLSHTLAQSLNLSHITSH
jgi:hypothetical protein